MPRTSRKNESIDIGENISAKVVDNTLVLEIDVSVKGRESNTKKSKIIATSAGSKYLRDLGMEKFGLNLNLFKVKKAYKKEDSSSESSETEKPKKKSRKKKTGKTES